MVLHSSHIIPGRIRFFLPILVLAVLTGGIYCEDSDLGWHADACIYSSTDDPAIDRCAVKGKLVLSAVPVRMNGAIFPVMDRLVITGSDRFPEYIFLITSENRAPPPAAL